MQRPSLFTPPQQRTHSSPKNNWSRRASRRALSDSRWASKMSTTTSAIWIRRCPPQREVHDEYCCEGQCQLDRRCENGPAAQQPPRQPRNSPVTQWSLLRSATRLCAREAAALAAHMDWSGGEGEEKDSGCRAVDRNRRSFSQPGTIKLFCRHVPATVEQLPGVLRESERPRGTRRTGLPQSRMAAGSAGHCRCIPAWERYPAGC